MIQIPSGLSIGQQLPTFGHLVRLRMHVYAVGRAVARHLLKGHNKKKQISLGLISS